MCIFRSQIESNVSVILDQMWKYNPWLRTLDNKDGNWKYMEYDWTLPLKEEKEKVYIETLKGDVLELNPNPTGHGKDLTVFLRFLNESSSKLIKKQ